MSITKFKKREDLIGKTGENSKEITIIDATEDDFGIDIRVKETDGTEYWTVLDSSISLD